MYDGGRKRGATKSPTVQVGPPNGNDTASKRTTPRHGHNPQSPQPRNTPTTTRPNLNNQREPQPRPQVENNQTRTQPARQATHKTSPPPQKRTATHKAPTSRQQPPPNRRTTRTKNHSTPSGRGGELRRGLRGTAPTRHTTHHPGPTPPKPTPPPTRHPNPKTQPHPETQHRSQDPHHPPDTPPPTPHQIPCTHAMGHIQPTSTLANKLEQTQEASPRKSKLQMRRPRPSHHPTTHQTGGR